MSGKEDIQFIKFIGERLSTEETRNLWMPMASEYERPDGGLDAVAVWLEAERSTLITRLSENLAELNEQIRS